MKLDLIAGDCLKVLPTLSDNSIDSCVTDPPYELGFMGKKWDASGIAYNVSVWREVLRVLKPGAHLLAFGGTRTHHRMVCAIEDAGFEIRDEIDWVYGSGFPKSLNVGNGFGTALKPAKEPICLARKPLVGTVAENLAQHGTGALNIDGCRVACEPIHTSRNIALGTSGAGIYGAAKTPAVFQNHVNGRWPANFCHDGSEEVLACFPVSRGQQGAVGPEHGEKLSVNTYGDFGPRQRFDLRGDVGSAARFFYCPKASKADREEGCEALPEKTAAENVDREPGSEGTNSPRAGAGRTSGRRNNHPTVKPTELMRWLCRLITPPGGTVLDPFMGSGSTGKAAGLEGFGFVGIELSPEYLQIARHRIVSACV